MQRDAPGDLARSRTLPESRAAVPRRQAPPSISQPALDLRDVNGPTQMLSSTATISAFNAVVMRGHPSLRRGPRPVGGRDIALWHSRPGCAINTGARTSLINIYVDCKIPPRSPTVRVPVA